MMDRLLEIKGAIYSLIMVQRNNFCQCDNCYSYWSNLLRTFEDSCNEAAEINQTYAEAFERLGRDSDAVLALEKENKELKDKLGMLIDAILDEKIRLRIEGLAND